MKKLLFLFIFLAGLVFTSCEDKSPVLTETQKAAIEKQVLEQWEKIGAAIENADAQGYASFLSYDGFFNMFSQGYSYCTREQYVDTVKVWFGQRKSNEQQNKKIKVNVLSTNMVLLDQESVFIATFKDDRILKINHIVSFLFKKEGTGWMIIHGHESWKGV